MNLSEKDKKFIWHPFTPQKNGGNEIVIEKAEGSYYYDSHGKKYIDAISSWWVNLHGHSHPYIAKKIAEQASTMEHIMFSGFTHAPAIHLAEKLLNHLPSNQSKIFFSDNGSTAVEVAIKMALQFWNNRGEEKPLFIALENAYHGDTFGGMSVGERNVFNQAFEKLLFNVVHIPLPTKNNITELESEMETLVKNHPVAGFIFEPLVQGAAGMLMYESEFLDRLLNVCKKNKVITIADEVMTGFGRTGKFFASDYLENKPDIICMSKGLTGGFMPLGATSCAGFIHEAFISEDKEKTFFHGHSYTANPLACSAALASMELMEDPKTFNQINMISESHLAFSDKVKSNKAVKNIRVKGTILAIELKTDEETHYLNSAAQMITDFFLNKGILLRPLGNVFYLIPPYCISKDDMQVIYAAIEEFLVTR